MKNSLSNAQEFLSKQHPNKTLPEILCEYAEQFTKDPEIVKKSSSFEEFEMPEITAELLIQTIHRLLVFDDVEIIKEGSINSSKIKIGHFSINEVIETDEIRYWIGLNNKDYFIEYEDYISLVDLVDHIEKKRFNEEIKWMFYLTDVNNGTV